MSWTIVSPQIAAFRRSLASAASRQGLGRGSRRSAIGSRRRAARRHRRPAELAREVSALQATLLGKLREEMRERRRRRVRRRRAAAGRGVRLGHRGRRRRRAPPRGRPQPALRCRRADRPQPSELPSLYRPGQMRRRLDQLIETHRRYGHPFGLVVFDVDGPGGAQRRPAAAGDGAGGGRRGAARQHPPRRRGLPARGGRDLRPRAEPGHGRRGADGRAAAAASSTSWSGGGPADRDLGRRRRLPRARRRRRRAAAQGRRGDVAGPRGRASRSASAPLRALCKIADRFAKSVHNWRKPGIRWENPLAAKNSAATDLRCPESEPTPPPKCSASAPTRCAAGSAATASRRRSAPSATTATTSWSSCRPCATRSPRPATSPRRSSWPASARRRRPAAASLLAALESFDEDAADRAIEESLALRPLERTVEELLLPAIDRLAADPDREAELEFASRWATGWLHGARRLASAASRPAGILLLDSSQRPGRRGGPRPGARPDPAPRRLPRPDALQRARRRAARARPAAPSTRPRSSSAAPAPTPPARSSWSARSATLGFDAPLFGFRASGLIGDAVPSAGERPERGDRDAQRRPAPPRRPGIRLAPSPDDLGGLPGPSARSW